MNYTNEQQLLKLLIMRPSEILECKDLTGKHFETRYNGVIFDTISMMFDQKKPISVTGIRAEIGEEWCESILLEINKARVDGGASILSESIIDEFTGSSAAAMVRSYADILESRRGRSDLILELMEKLGQLTTNIVPETLTTADVVSLQMLNILRNPDKTITSVKTGIPKLDWFTGGVQRGLLTIVAGLPGMGKSTFMANLIINMASAGEHPYVASLEDRALYVVGRMNARLNGINSEYINKCQNLSMADVDKIERNIERNRDMLSRIHIDDASGQSVARIRRTAMYLQAQGKMTVTFADHLGEVASKYQNKYDAATKNAEGLRDIATDANVPVISGAQVARSAVSSYGAGSNVKHMDCIPRPHHLRDSGRIEEVARAIWFVHRPHVWNNDEPDDEFWVSVAKSTHGQTKIVKLKCDLKTMTIADDEKDLLNGEIDPQY